MKAAITLLLILFFAMAARAQDMTPSNKAVVVQTKQVQVPDIQLAEAKVVRLYRRSGSRVRKAIKFDFKKEEGLA